MSGQSTQHRAASAAISGIVSCLEDNAGIGRALGPELSLKSQLRDVPTTLQHVMSEARKGRVNGTLTEGVKEIFERICTELNEAYSLLPQRDVTLELFRFVVKRFAKRLAGRFNLENFQGAEGKLLASRLALIMGREMQALHEMKLSAAQIRSLSGRLEPAKVFALYQQYPRQVASYALGCADPEDAAKKAFDNFEKDFTYLVKKLSGFKRAKRIARCIRGRSFTSKHDETRPHGSAPILLERYIECLAYAKRHLRAKNSSIAASLAIHAYRSKRTSEKPLGILPELIKRYLADKKFLENYAGGDGQKVAQKVARSFALVSCLKSRKESDYEAPARHLIEMYFRDIEWITQQVGSHAASMIAMQSSRTVHNLQHPQGKAPIYIKQLQDDEAWVKSQLEPGEPNIGKTIAIHSYASKRDQQRPHGSAPVFLARFRAHYGWLLERTTPEIALEIASKSFYHTIVESKSEHESNRFKVPATFLARTKKIMRLINTNKSDDDGDIAYTIALTAFPLKDHEKRALQILEQYQKRRVWVSKEYHAKSKELAKGNGHHGREIVLTIAAQGIRSRVNKENPLGSAPLLLDRYFKDKAMALVMLTARSHQSSLNGDLGDLSRTIASRTYNTEEKADDHTRAALVVGAIDRYIGGFLSYHHLTHLRAGFAHVALWALNGEDACRAHQIAILKKSGMFAVTKDAASVNDTVEWSGSREGLRETAVSLSEALTLVDQAIDRLPPGTRGRVCNHITGQRRNVGSATAEDLKLFSDSLHQIAFSA